MINPDDPTAVEHAVENIQQELAKYAYLEIRDTVGFIPDEVVVAVTYPNLTDGTPHTVEIHLRVDKEMFEEMFIENVKRRLLEDAKRFARDPGADDSDFADLPGGETDTPE